MGGKEVKFILSDPSFMSKTLGIEITKTSVCFDYFNLIFSLCQVVYDLDFFIAISFAMREFTVIKHLP